MKKLLITMMVTILTACGDCQPDVMTGEVMATQPAPTPVAEPEQPADKPEPIFVCPQNSIGCEPSPAPMPIDRHPSPTMTDAEPSVIDEPINSGPCLAIEPCSKGCTPEICLCYYPV